MNICDNGKTTSIRDSLICWAYGNLLHRKLGGTLRNGRGGYAKRTREGVFHNVCENQREIVFGKNGYIATAYSCSQCWRRHLNTKAVRHICSDSICRRNDQTTLPFLRGGTESFLPSESLYSRDNCPIWFDRRYYMTLNWPINTFAMAWLTFNACKFARKYVPVAPGQALMHTARRQRPCVISMVTEMSKGVD